MQVDRKLVLDNADVGTYKGKYRNLTIRFHNVLCERTRAFDLTTYKDGTISVNVRTRKRTPNNQNLAWLPRVGCFWIARDGSIRKPNPAKEKLRNRESLEILDRWEEFGKLFVEHMKQFNKVSA